MEIFGRLHLEPRSVEHRLKVSKWRVLGNKTWVEQLPQFHLLRLLEFLQVLLQTVQAGKVSFDLHEHPYWLKGEMPRHVNST